MCQPGDTESSLLRKLVESPGGSACLSDADTQRWLVGVAGQPSSTDEELCRILAGNEFDTDVTTTIANLAAKLDSHIS